MLTSRVIALTLFAAPLACGERRTDDAADTTPPARGPIAPISVQHEREFDLTGDTFPEIVRATAVGSRYDSLDVRLEIRARDGTPLYADRWNSRLYFIYEDRARFSDAEVLRKVRGHVQRLVSDSAYYDPRTGRLRPQHFQVDRETVAYSVAERNWRDRNAIPDTASIPPEAHNEIRTRDAAADRVDRLVTELLLQPAFAYYAGGEANYVVAWSPSERRFFTIWACC